MNGEGFDHIFADLVDGSEDLLAYLSGLQELVPACEFQLHTPGGVLPADPPLSLETDEKDLLVATRREAGPVAVAGMDCPLYAMAVPQLTAVLVFRPATGDPTVDPALAALIRTSSELTLLRRDQKNLELENQQIQRQIEVLNRQHHKLVEDNYRQYCLIQKREKDYARKLETEIARQTAELREANARLEEASRLKSEFLANMSHELRTPLNAIIGFAELLAESEELEGEQEEYAVTIRSAADSLLILINEILDLAKIEAGKVELEILPFAISEVVAVTGNLFRVPAREKGVAFSARSDERLNAPVLGDSNRLKQILINLVGNALKFTEEGSVELRAELVEEKEKGIVVRFSVQDTGTGIPPERQVAIFEKFTQADGSTTRKYGGTGLGLAICKQLVELMDGEISLASTPGQGSVFSFALPLAFAQTPAPAVRPAESEPQPSPEEWRKRVVLLVEDNPVNQRLATIMIRKQNCEVLTAGDGIEALDFLREHDCDLVLMDFQMPRLDGLAATRKIRELEASPAKAEYAGLREKTGPIPIIGLTAHARRQDEQESYEAGMNGFLTKPIVRDKLTAVLRQYLS